MNFFIKSSFVLVFIFLSLCANGQNEVKNILPLSPAAAEFSRYVEMPVNFFTGVPDISIPMYKIKSGSLELPLNLSYHAGGNRVESQATWVGLSWSLGTLPIISRSVNSMPDENASGGIMFYKYNGYTLRDLENQRLNGNTQNFNGFMSLVKQNIADSQPDVFSLSIDGFNGKFYYSQEQQKFITYPLSNIIINFISNGFVVTSPNGTKYFFNDREISNTGGSDVTSSWMISKIFSSTALDEISFSYENESVSSRFSSGDVKYQFVNGVACSTNIPPDNVGNMTVSNVQSKVLSSISFKGGYVSFTRQSTPREDLLNSYALNQVSIYNNANEIVKRFQFNFKYLSGGGSGYGCSINDMYLGNKWLLLASLQEISASGNLVHNFTYDESQVPSCRNSTARDYWGYYNGVSTNLNLIPTTSVPNTSPAIIIPGADRSVNANYTQFGILKRIQYPTGGYTTFNYENNKVVDDYVPGTYINEAANIDSPNQSSWPTYQVYNTVFNINNPPDAVLNQNNQAGGAYLKVEFGDTGVPPGDSGVTLRLRGTSPSNSNVSIYFSNPFQNYYIPNGDYEITVTFNQDPPAYQNFYLVASWQKRDSTAAESYAGGLRIKEIKTYDNPSASPIVKTYKYTESYDSERSSGELFINDRFTFYDVLTFYSNSDAFCVGDFMRIKAYSNQPQISFSGSAVGYKNVFVSTDALNQSGMTAYQYNTYKDIESGGFPYPPPQSMEAFRGRLVNITYYKPNGNGGFQKIKREEYQYKHILQDSTPLFGYKTDNENGGSNSTLGLSIPFYIPFSVAMGWSEVEQRTETNYSMHDENTFSQQITDYVYDMPYNQVKEKIVSTSDNRLNIHRYYYPYDLNLTNDAELARIGLISSNNISTSLKEEQLIGNVPVQTMDVEYKIFNGADMILPYHTKIYQNPVEGKNLYFNSYSPSGQLREQFQENGMKTCYLYSYNSENLIAEIKNSDYATVESVLSAAAIQNFANLPNPDKAAVDAFLAPLKTNLPNALITTYTYKPLVGMTSQTDAKGMTTYYDYDAFGRLQYVKDQNGNIVKANTYHYKN